MIKLEVCVDSIEGTEAAVRGGADRIELCSALSEGGLTPSYGLMKSAATLAIPCVALIRPRPGNFQFTRRELDVMLADIDAVRENGLAGVVLGAQAEHGGLDTDLLNRLIEHSQGLSVNLHRVIDVVSHPLRALDDAIQLGFERVLTSGGCANAIEGLPNIAKMLEHANGRICVMPGCGLNAGNIRKVIATGVSDVHASCSSPLLQKYCLPAPDSAKAANRVKHSATSQQLVADMRSALDGFGKLIQSSTIKKPE